MLLTDIVASTQRAAQLGDARWRAVLERHDEVTRGQVASFGGTFVKSTGDGALATFDGPATAIRCTEAMRAALAQDQISIRAGLHAGEIERMGEDIAGVGVHIAARVCAQAAAGEILVSQTIADLVIGSGLAFRSRGRHQLKGVPGSWELLAVTTRSAASDDEEQLARIHIDSARTSQRRMDRAAAALARHRPGVIRAAIHLDPRYRRSIRAR